MCCCSNCVNQMICYETPCLESDFECSVCIGCDLCPCGCYATYTSEDAPPLATSAADQPGGRTQAAQERTGA